MVKSYERGIAKVRKAAVALRSRYRNHNASSTMDAHAKSSQYSCAQQEEVPTLYRGIGLYDDSTGCDPQQASFAKVQSWLLQVPPNDSDLLRMSMQTPPAQHYPHLDQIPAAIQMSKDYWKSADLQYEQNVRSQQAARNTMTPVTHNLNQRGHPEGISFSRRSAPSSASAYGGKTGGANERSLMDRPAFNTLNSSQYSATSAPAPQRPPHPQITYNPYAPIPESAYRSASGAHVAGFPFYPGLSHPLIDPRYPNRFIPADPECHCNDCVLLRRQDRDFMRHAAPGAIWSPQIPAMAEVAKWHDDHSRVDLNKVLAEAEQMRTRRNEMDYQQELALQRQQPGAGEERK